MSNPLKAIAKLARKFTDISLGIRDIRQDMLQLQLLETQRLQSEILSRPRYQEPKRLVGFGYKIFSQRDEDGIINEIFARVGADSKTFLEIGVENGWECNTTALLYSGWKGSWFEGSSADVASIKRTFADRISAGQLSVTQQFVTRSFCWEMQERWPALRTIDLLSLDIDGNDYHIIDALPEIRARVLVLEYNAKLRPPINWHMPYKSDYVWDGSDYTGVSLTAWVELLQSKGYSLVGCNIAGVNAFFVRSDLVGDKFAAPFTAENHYEPARYAMLYSSGHPIQRK